MEILDLYCLIQKGGEGLEFVRWYSVPVFAGFIYCMMLNPLFAGAEFLSWLALLSYIIKRCMQSTEDDGSY